MPEGARVLDVGCGDGELLRRLKDRVAHATGIDPRASTQDAGPRVDVVVGRFPADLEAPDGSFDVVAAAAVLEHIPEGEQGAFARACRRFLRAGGEAVLTVPSRRVDTILRWLRRLRLAHGEAAEEHHGFDWRRTQPLFAAAGFALARHSSFELGLNHLFVFTKLEADGGSSPDGEERGRAQR